MHHEASRAASPLSDLPHTLSRSWFSLNQLIPLWNSSADLPLDALATSLQRVPWVASGLHSQVSASVLEGVEPQSHQLPSLRHT
jgi:hypothetical protein